MHNERIPSPSSMEFRDPMDPWDLNGLLFAEPLDLDRERYRDGLDDALDNDDFSLWPLSQLLFISFPSPILSQLESVDERGSQRKLLKLWLKSDLSFTNVGNARVALYLRPWKQMESSNSMDDGSPSELWSTSGSSWQSSGVEKSSL
ncbi:hypothetical protein ACHAWF_013501 [Thalassiosira exigua]